MNATDTIKQQESDRIDQAIERAIDLLNELIPGDEHISNRYIHYNNNVRFHHIVRYISHLMLNQMEKTDLDRMREDLAIKYLMEQPKP